MLHSFPCDWDVNMKCDVVCMGKHFDTILKFILWREDYLNEV